MDEEWDLELWNWAERMERKMDLLKVTFRDRICDNPNLTDVEWDDLPGTLKYLLQCEGAPQGSERWKKERAIVSASDAGAIGRGYLQFGFVLKTARHVFDRVIGMSPGMEENDATRHGHKNEGRAATWYAQRTGCVLFDGFPSIKHPLIPWMAASPDRIALMWGEDGVPRVVNVEIKCPLNKEVTQENIRNVEAVKLNFPHYYDQVMFQMMCLGLTETHFVMCGYAPNPNHLEEDAFAMCRIPFDPDWWTTYRPHFVDFARAVYEHRGIPFPPLNPFVAV